MHGSRRKLTGQMEVAGLRPMKLIIAGSRHLKVSPVELFELITYFKLHPTEIVSGTAKGIDQCGEDFAKNAYLKLTKFYPDWDKYGKKAGPFRNQEMAKYSDALLLIWDGKSKGSLNMLAEMRRLGKPIYEARTSSLPSVSDHR